MQDRHKAKPNRLGAGLSAKVRYFQGSDGVQIVADDEGPDDASVVILLHGGGQTRHSWLNTMQTLVAQGYRVLKYDLRGHGDSDWSEAGAYGLDDGVGDLRTIVADVDRPYALVGASLGGAIAIHAVASGLRPEAVILVDIVPHAAPAGIERIVGFMRANLDGFASLEDAIDAVSAYNPDRPRAKDTTGLMRNLRLRENGRLYWHWDPRIVAEQPDTQHKIVQRSSVAMAARTELPIFLVRGLKSDVVSDAGVAALREIIPWLEVADVSGAGHMVAGDKNDAFSASVIEFLMRNLPTAPKQ